MKQISIKFINFIRENKLFILFFLISLAVFLFWLVAYYPGIMTPDSNDQWSQAHALAFNNHHPFFHTLLIALLQRIWYDPAFIALIQIILAAFLGAYFLDYLIKKGLSKIIAFVVFLIYIASPAVGIYNITLWKDIPFSLGIFTLSILFVMHYLDGLPKSNTRLIIFALIITIIASLRHNGIAFIILIPSIYYLLKLASLKKTLIIFVTSLIGLLFIQFPLASIAKVNKANFISSATFIHMVAGVIDGGYIPTDEEKLVIEKMISIESLKENYDCRNGNSLYFNNPSYNGDALQDDNYKRQFDSVAIRIIRSNLPLVLANRSCAFANMVGLNSLVFYIGEPGIGQDMVDKYDLPQFERNKVSDLAQRYITASFTHQPIMLVYWNIMPFILISLGIFGFKRNKLTAGYLIISLFNLIPLLVGGVGGDFRFVYSIQITGIFMIALLFLPKKNNKEEVLSWRTDR